MTWIILLILVLEVMLIHGFQFKRIYFCDSIYMTRLNLLELGPFGSIMINWFHRGDEDRELHDHPWDFVSIILWRGYIEETPNHEAVNNRPPHFWTKKRGELILEAWDANIGGGYTSNFDHEVSFTQMTRKYPGMILWRPRRWAHRVHMVAPGKGAITLVWTGPKKRVWGFYTKNGWVKWTDFIFGKEC